ncbi:DUF5982 domain-containing protein, partial [Flavobacterium psychrolimnae]
MSQLKLIKKILFCFILTISTYSINAQVNDTLSFVKSKRMSDDDLAKKREGTFITG